MISIITFIGCIIILVIVLNLKSRVERMEQLMKNGAPQRATESSYQPEPRQLETDQSITSGPAQPVLIEPTLIDKLVDWVKEDWLIKIGAGLLLIGFGWLATYAFLNNWIGPMGRIALGIIAGSIFILIGWWRIKKYISQGGIFLVLGSTIILLTTFAARELYDFFTPTSALALMFLSTAFVALASIKYNNRVLSLLSLTLASIAPLFINAPSTNHIAYFGYLFVVIIGAIWIVMLTGQRELTTAALAIIFIYSIPHLLSPSSFPLADIQKLLWFAYAFAAVFFLTNTIGIIKSKNENITPDLITASGNGLFLLTWIMIAAPDEWKSLIIAGWMILFAIGAFLIFMITKKREPFYVYAGVGIAMLAAATSVELKGAALIIAYTIESGIITFITYAILRDVKIAQKISLLLFVPMFFSIGSITSRSWATSVINKDFFVLLILGLTLLGLGTFFSRYVQKTEYKESRQINSILLVFGSVYIYILLWLSLHAGLQNINTATMISLVIYTIVGLASYLYGVANKNNSIRLYGSALIGIVTGRLLLIDIWNMEIAGRIVTFFLIGALLMSTAFFGRKKQNKDFSENFSENLSKK